MHKGATEKSNIKWVHAHKLRSREPSGGVGVKTNDVLASVV